jgi:hypothetical protein
VVWVDKIAAKRPGINKGEEKTNPGVAPERKTTRQLRSSKTAEAGTPLIAVSTRVPVNKFLASVSRGVCVMPMVLLKLM